MTPEQWQRVFAIVRAARELDESQQASFLAEKCMSDGEIRNAAQSLLRSEKEMGSFLEEPGCSPTLASRGTEHLSLEGVSNALARGATLGRYVVLDLLGSGGMGVVYAAFDPGLSRKLAIKLLRPEAASCLRGDEVKARLLREAQAMACLSHANVIAVHDVGTVGGEVFIAMEYVDGCTLKEWLKAEQRDWPEIVAMFLQAGRGLSAAHSAGIVHRDFKPDNVLVGKDGRARVLDFGLARGAEAAEDEQAIQLDAHGQNATSMARQPLAGNVTKTGTLIGTPAYMAPEQIGGGQVDARTDQFSFCAALYQALYRELPFEGDTLSERLIAVREGRLRSSKAPTKVPGWLRSVVIQGLQPESGARHPSMDVLLHQLHQNPAKPWRRISAVAALVLATAVPLVSYRAVVRSQSLPCQGAAKKLAEIWDPKREDAIHQAFLSTTQPQAAEVFRSVKRALDQQAQSWVAMHTEACQATRVRGEQSDELLDLRMGCLQSRLEEMRALTDLFAQASARIVETSVEAANALTPLRGCADAVALRERVQPSIISSPSFLSTQPGAVSVEEPIASREKLDAVFKPASKRVSTERLRSTRRTPAGLPPPRRRIIEIE
jgi:serine/threonine protein kinase